MRHLTLHSTRLVTWDGPGDIVAKGLTRNMYGCLPCPRCGSGYRASYKRDGALFIDCDACGKVQRAVMREWVT